MGVCSILGKFMGLVVLLVAILVGVIVSGDCPMGDFFWYVFQPLRLQDHFKGKITPPVPPELKAAPRPSKEITFKLPSGAEMPGSGIGMCCRGTAYDPTAVRATTLWYLLQGGRLIDTADLYRNHKEIGLGIKDGVARGVPRSEIFVTTKVWPGRFGYKETKSAMARMLKELDLEYIDLILLHAPFGMKGLILGAERSFKNHADCNSTISCWEGTWKALGEYREQGKLKDIGVSNFNCGQLNQLRSLAVVKKHPVAVNQVPFNPWVPKFQKNIVAYCQKHNIALTGYSTLGGTFGKEGVAMQATLKKIADRHKVSVYLVLSRWSLQRGVAVIPGTGNPKHMVSNLGVFSFELSEQEMSLIDAFTESQEEAPMFFSFAPEDDATACAL